MNSCKIIKIETPKKFILNGLWFGPKIAKNVFIYVHGLSGSVFSQHDVLEKLAQNKNTAVLTFNNRGSGIINRVKRINPNKKKGYESHIIGQAHEVFTDCIDDINGAVNFINNNKINIYLLGHSTGCQKIIYYLSKQTKSPVSKAILLSPLSDYASAVATLDPKLLNKTVAIAQKMVRSNKSHEIMPKKVCPWPHDAQRFLSLHTPESIEEIFSYSRPKKNPMVLKKVKIPMLFVFAGKDEYLDRPTEEIVEWFKNVLNKQTASFEIIKNAPHNFKNQTISLIKLINTWVKIK